MTSINRNYGKNVYYGRKALKPVQQTTIVTGTETTPVTSTITTTARTEATLVTTSYAPSTTAAYVKTEPVPNEPKTVSPQETTPVAPTATSDVSKRSGYNGGNYTTDTWNTLYGTFVSSSTIPTNGSGSVPINWTNTIPTNSTVSLPNSATDGFGVNIGFGNGWGLNNNTVSIGNTGANMVLGESIKGISTPVTGTIGDTNWYSTIKFTYNF